MSVKRALSKVVHDKDRKPSVDTSHTNGDWGASPTAHEHRSSISPIFHIGHRGSRGSISAILNDSKEYVDSSDVDSSDYDSDGVSKNAQKRLAREQKKQSKSRLSMDSTQESEQQVKKRLEEASTLETDEMRARYGKLPLVQSTVRGTTQRLNFADLHDEMVGQEITFRCRLHHARKMGLKLVFLIFRQQIHTLQGVLHEEPSKISALMVHWAEHIHIGSILRVTGTLQKPSDPVKSSTIHNMEVHVSDLKIIVERTDPSELHMLLMLLRLTVRSSFFRPRS